MAKDEEKDEHRVEFVSSFLDDDVLAVCSCGWRASAISTLGDVDEMRRLEAKAREHLAGASS